MHQIVNFIRERFSRFLMFLPALKTAEKSSGNKKKKRKKLRASDKDQYRKQADSDLSGLLHSHSDNPEAFLTKVMPYL